MADKNPRFEDGTVNALRFPDKMMCKDCAFRAEDVAGGQISGATLGRCFAYKTKPLGILLDGDECAYYLNENEKEEE